MNLHAISTANLALNLSYVVHCKEEKNEFLKEDVDSNNGYDTLDNKRTLTIDYSSGSRWKTSIKILIPNLIVWLMAIFISIPSCIVSFTRDRDSKCIPKRLTYDVLSILSLSEIFIISIKVFVPVCLIFLTLFMVIRKKRRIRDLGNDLVDENPHRCLKIASSMAFIFLLLQSPKLIFDAIILFLRDLNLRIVKNVFYLLYYFGILMRLILCKILVRDRK